MNIAKLMVPWVTPAVSILFWDPESSLLSYCDHRKSEQKSGLNMFIGSKIQCEEKYLYMCTLCIGKFDKIKEIKVSYKKKLQ